VLVNVLYTFEGREKMVRENNLILFKLIKVIMVAITIILIADTLFCGNFWYFKNNVLRELRLQHPQITEVIMVKRRFFSESFITVKEKGNIKNYCLNTNFFWDYDISECPKPK
jgi:hypothetical protein